MKKRAAAEAQVKAEREKKLAAQLAEAEAKKREAAAKKPVSPGKSEPPKPPAGKPAGEMKAGGEKKAPATLPKDFAGLMQAGAAFEKQKQWAEAVQAYREAVRLNPNDAKAAAALTNARFEKQMAEGRENLKARKFTEAVADFEIAVKLKPKDAEAVRLLEEAKRGKP